MASTEVAASVEKALKELESSLEDYIERKPSNAELKIWRASSEVEYALFLLEVDGELVHPKLENLNCEEGRQDPVKCVVRAQSFLQEALKLCATPESRGQVSEKLWVAKCYLLTLQENVEKK